MTQTELKDFAGEVQTAQQPRPHWLATLSYVLVAWGLWFFVSTANQGGLDGPNPVILILLAMWLVYTPIAVRRKWFTIGL